MSIEIAFSVMPSDFRNSDHSQKIAEKLVEGESLTGIAKWLQIKCKEFTNVHQKSLVRRLKRTKERYHEKLNSVGSKVSVQYFELKNLEDIARMQHARIEHFRRQERLEDSFKSSIISEVKGYSALLKTIVELKQSIGIYNKAGEDTPLGNKFLLHQENTIINNISNSDIDDPILTNAKSRSKILRAMSILENEKDIIDVSTEPVNGSSPTK